MSPTQSRRNLSQAVAEEILEWIRAGKLVPGQLLPTQKELTGQFGVGANAIREACQSLVMMGILDIRPGRGAMVISASTDSVMGVEAVSALLENQTVLDLGEFRRIVEVEIADLAAQRASEEDIERIGTALEDFRRTLNAGLPVFRTDIEFHRAVAVAAHNPVFINVLDALGDLLGAARRQTEGIPGTVEKALAEHEKVYQAILNRDGTAAKLAMIHHLESVVRATASAGAHHPALNAEALATEDQ